MMLYKNMKVKVRSPKRETDYLYIVEGVLQGYTLVPYLFIISLDHVLRTSIDLIKENGFKLVTILSRRYQNALGQAQSPVHSLEGAAGVIGLHVNADKTEYFNQRGNISSLNGVP